MRTIALPPSVTRWLPAVVVDTDLPHALMRWLIALRNRVPKLPKDPDVTEDNGAIASPGALNAWQAYAVRIMWVVGLFSVAVNLLMLTLPIYLFQISDRVLTSRSLETLLMLSALALAFIGILSIVDILRRQVLGRLATKMEALLGGAVLASSINNARVGEGGTIQAIRSLHQVRGFISSPVMLLLMDAPLSPLYFGVIFLVHRDLGYIAVVAGLALALSARASHE